MQKRRSTRSNVWPDTDATIKVQDPRGINKSQHLTVTGKVENLGSRGMFFITDEFVPISGFAEITIHFDSNICESVPLVQASGRVVRLAEKGVGIKFTSINLKELQKCILKKINQSNG
jgi:hypothetical protein